MVCETSTTDKAPPMAGEITADQAITDGQSVKDANRNRAYRRKTRNAAILHARREAAAFAGIEEQAIANGDLDPRVLEVARMELE